MSESPQPSLSGSIVYCTSNEESTTGTLAINNSPELAIVTSPELLIFDTEMVQSPTLTLPEDFMIPEIPLSPQITPEANTETLTLPDPAEATSQLTALELCKYHSNL